MPGTSKRCAMLTAGFVILCLGPLTITTARGQVQPLSAAAPASAGAAVTAIGVAAGKGATEVTISGDGNLQYEYFVIEGKSLVIDLPGATSTVWPAEQQVDDPFISRVRVARLTGEKPGVRVALDLNRPDGFTVSGDGARVVVAFASGEPAAPGAASTMRVNRIDARAAAGVLKISIGTSAPPDYRVLDSGDPRQVRLALDRAVLAGRDADTFDFSHLGGPVQRVSARAEDGDPPRVLVTIELSRPAPYRVSAGASGLELEFSAAALRGEPRQAVLPKSPDAAAPTGGAPGSARNDAGPGGYSGAKITLDFLDADITDIFRLIAEVSSMNIVAGDDVKGKRSVKMTEVPWDQALDLILKTNIPPLVRIADGANVLRITTLQRVLDEQAAVEKRRLEQLQRAAAEQRQELERTELERKVELEAQAQLLAKAKAERQRSKGWRERTFKISYGITREMGARLKNFSSGCPDGCIFEIGEESQTIFVRDFVDNVEQMTAVYEALEAPTPAVMVEARIVEVQNDYAEALGIQWGAKFVADPAHGNAAPFAFPNAISVGGAIRESDGGPGTFLVNLPATNAVSGVGFTLGHIANTMSLDLKLSAMEKLGRSKILSSPKVLAMQNAEAEINIGSQLPVPKTDTEGNRTVEWKKVGITLRVTPIVTSDSRIIMSVDIKKDARSESVQTTEGEMFSIDDRSARTKVLVADGETSVIGGIFQQEDSGSDDGVPGLSRLPLIGWMFKSRSVLNSRKELLIFLTPRIVNPPGAQTAALPAGASRPESFPSSPPHGAASASGGVFGTITLLKAEAVAGDGVQVEVGYVNDTSFTFTDSVTLNCRAYAADGSVIGANNAHVRVSELGPIGPGFARRESFAIPLDAAGYATTRCTVLQAE